MVEMTTSGVVPAGADGLPTEAWLDTLDDAQLEAWIGDRLAGTDPWFPVRESDDTRGALLRYFCHGRSPSDRHLRRIAGIVTALAEKQASLDEPDPLTCAETFDLYGDLSSVCSATPDLVDALDGTRFAAAWWQEHRLDQRLLAAMGRRPLDLGRLQWQRFLDAPRFCELALAAVQDGFGRDHAASELGQRIGLFRDNAEHMDLTLTLHYLLRDAPDPVRLLAVLDTALDEPADREAIDDCLTALGTGLSLRSKHLQLVPAARMARALDRLGIAESNDVAARSLRGARRRSPSLKPSESQAA